MGMWTSVEGTCSGFKKNKVSLKKLLKDFFGGEDWNLEYTEDCDNNEIITLDLRYEESGRKAFETFDSLCDVLYEAGVTFDLSVTIRTKS